MKNNSLVKRQHYVWREYLRSWSSKDQIPTFLINEDKIISTNLMNVAQKRFFYEFHDLTNQDIEFLKVGINESPKPVKSLLNDILEDQILIKDLKKYADKNSLNKPESMNILEKNGFESYHTLIENNGKKIINCRSIDDLKLFNNEKDKIDAFMYLSMQYFRTKKRRDNVNESNIQFRHIINFDKIFGILSIIMATNVAFNLSISNSISYNLLQIKGPSNFMTSDQPVINLLANTKDSSGNVNDLEIYCPLSPKHAIKIQTDTNKRKYNSYEPTDKEVNELNKIMISEAHDYLFSNMESQLKDYTQHGV